MGGQLIHSPQHGFYLHNARGDVIQRTDNQGSIIHTYQYDAFGNEINYNTNNNPNDPNNTNPFRFAAEYWDSETQTYYLRARHFNPRTGRFTQPDPFWNIHNMQGSNAAILQSGNLFVYTMNSPVMWVDPSGQVAVLAGLVSAITAPFTTTHNRDRNNPYTLTVDRFDLGTSVGRALIPLSNVATAAANLITGRRSIDTGWWAAFEGAATGVDIALAIQNPATLLLPGISSLVSAAEITTTLVTQGHQMSEAIYNHFDNSVWHSPTRSAVENRFNTTMVAMSYFVAAGTIEIRTGGEIFPNESFAPFTTFLSDPATLWPMYDPLTGRNMFFFQDRYYFYATCPSAYGLIQRMEGVLRNSPFMQHGGRW